MKLVSKYYLQLVFFVALFFGVIQPSYAIELEELRSEKVLEKSAVGLKTVKAWKFAFDCPPGVRTNTTILESLSNAIQRGAVNILPNSSLTEITETTISHILRGNPIGHGNPTGGFHHITALIKRTDVKLIDVTPVGNHGCYKAKLEFPNGNKPPKDFFPDDWNEAKVLSEIESAFVSPDKIPRPDLGSNTFTSVTDSGVPVYIQMNGNTMKSAFPYYE